MKVRFFGLIRTHIFLFQVIIFEENSLKVFLSNVKYRTYSKKKTKKKRQQKNMSQMKEQAKNLQEQINDEEIGNLPKKEFRVMIVKMIQNLRNRMEAWIEKIQEMFNKDLEE